MLLFTHTCPVTEFAVASHLNTANSCCHHVFLRHFRFQKCLPVYGNVLVSDVLDRFILYRKIKRLVVYLEKMIKLIQRGRTYDQDYKRSTGSKRGR